LLMIRTAQNAWGAVWQDGKYGTTHTRHAFGFVGTCESLLIT
jgi:hypothetical protein